MVAIFVNRIPVFVLNYFEMPRYLGLDYFKEASESYHKSTSEYFLSEPWHLEQEKDVVYAHKWKTSRALYSGLQPWKKVIPDVDFLAQEAQHVVKVDDLLEGFNPFQCIVYNRLSGVIPSSLEEENAEGNSNNSQMSQTNLTRSLLINKSTEIQEYNLNQLKPELENGHEKFLDEPILHDYLSEVQCVQIENEIKFEKIDNSFKMLDELIVNDSFLQKKWFPENPLKYTNECIEEQKQKLHEQYNYQKYSPVQLTGDKFDRVLQEMCDAHFENIEKINAWETKEILSKKILLKTESANMENCSAVTKVSENNCKIKNEQAQIRLTSTKIDLEDSLDKKDCYLHEKDAETNEKYIQQTINAQEMKTCYQNHLVQDTKSPYSDQEKKYKENDSVKLPFSITDICVDIGLQDFVTIAQNVFPFNLSEDCLNDISSKLVIFQSQGKESSTSENTVDSLRSVLLNLACQNESHSTDCQMSTKSDGEKEVSSMTNQIISDPLFHLSGVENDSGNLKMSCLENLPLCDVDDNHHAPPTKKLRKSNSSDILKNVTIDGEISSKESYSALNVCLLNPLDSFIFLRTGQAKKSQKEQIQEAELKMNNKPIIESGSNSNSATTAIAKKQEEIKLHFLPLITICSTSLSGMTELIRNLETTYNVHFVERNYETIFKESHSKTRPFVYADLILDERTSIVLCQMEELQNGTRFLNFRRRIHHLLLKFTTCWIIVCEPQTTTASLQAVFWKSSTILSIWASQLSSIQSDIQVKVLFSDNCSNIASTIRRICDHTIANNRTWTKSQWVDRPWILPEISEHERFLLAFPCINSFNAQAILGTMNIMQLMTAQLKDLVNNLPCIPPKVLKMLYSIIYWKSPIHEYLSFPDVPFIENVNSVAPNSSYPAPDQTNFQALLDADPKFTLQMYPSYSEPEKSLNYNSQKQETSYIPTAAALLQEHAHMSRASKFHSSKSIEKNIQKQPYLSIATSKAGHREPGYGKYSKEKSRVINTPSNLAWNWNVISGEKTSKNPLSTINNSETTMWKKPLVGKLRYQKVAGKKGQTCLTFN